MAEAGGFLLAFDPTIGGALRAAIYGLMMLHYGDLAWHNVLDDRSVRPQFSGTGMDRGN